MFAKFNLNYVKVATKVKRSILNFKSKDGQQKFFEVTNKNSKLSLCFDSQNADFSSLADKFMKNLNGIFRITNNRMK